MKSLMESTANQRLIMAEFMSVIEVYGPKKTYYNKFGERIQEWDEYGKKTAFREGMAEGLIGIACGATEEQALAAVEKFKESGIEVTRIEIL